MLFIFRCYDLKVQADDLLKKANGLLEVRINNIALDITCKYIFL